MELSAPARHRSESSYESLAELTSHLWLGLQQMREFAREPLIVSGGHGIRLRTADGRELIDGISGATVTSLGYGNPRVEAAMKEQIDGLLFWPMLHGTTEPALRLAERVASLMPADLDHVFFVSGGSEATEAAMKMARQYHAQTGHPGKYKIVGRYWGYHGSTMGALSASGLPLRRPFEPLLGGYVHAMPPYAYRSPFGEMSPEQCMRAAVEHIDSLIRFEGADSVAAVIADPVMAGAGVLVPSHEYYTRLREICDRYGVLLIFDEVLTGFGRLGSWFACEHYDVVPDIVCVGKAMTSGFAPIGAAVARDHVAGAFDGSWADGVQFLHLNTFGGHPLSCATSLAVLDEMERQDVVSNAKRVGTYLGEQLRGLSDAYDCVGDVRGLGMLWGIEFVTDRATKAQWPSEHALAPRVASLAYRNEALILRANRHVVQISPPLVTSEAEADDIVARFTRSLDAALANPDAGEMIIR